MAQEMRMFTAKLDNLSLIPGNHMMEGKNWYPLLSSDLRMCMHTK